MILHSGRSGRRLNTIIKGKRGVSPETAILLAALTGTSPEFWARLQSDYDLWHAMQRMPKPKVKALELVFPRCPPPSRSVLVTRRGLAQQVDRRAHALRELGGRAGAVIVQEDHPGRRAGHVMVDSHDVDAAGT